MHSLHPGQTVCILSASQPLCTIQQNTQKTKGSTEGGERTDRPNNKLNHKRQSLTLCVCVREPDRETEKQEEDEGDEDKCRRGERQRAAEKKKDRGRNQICKNITKSCIFDKREHTGVFV